MSLNCSVCGDNLTDGAHCSVCGKELHFACAGLTESGYRKLGERKLTWRCPLCKKSEYRSPLSNSVRDGAVLSEIRDLAAKLAPLTTLGEDVKALRAEILELKGQLTKEFNDKFNEFNDKFTKLTDRVKKIEKVQDRVVSIEAELDKLKQEAEEKDQWSRMNNAEIKGVPETGNENLFNIINSIGSQIHYPVTKTQINFITRVPTRDNTQPKPIIVSFVNRYVKEDFIAAARSEIKKSEIRAAHLGLVGNYRVFVNDHLTPQKKELLTKTKKLAKEKDFAYSWVKHAKIYVRKDDTSPVILVKSATDLLKIK